MHRQPLGALAGKTISQLRGMAASDDPSERERIRTAIARWPALAEVVGPELMRRLRDDAEAGR